MWLSDVCECRGGGCDFGCDCGCVVIELIYELEMCDGCQSKLFVMNTHKYLQMTRAQCPG